jgi:hypothetical protein
MTVKFSCSMIYDEGFIGNALSKTLVSMMLFFSLCNRRGPIELSMINQVK